MDRSRPRRVLVLFVLGLAGLAALAVFSRRAAACASFFAATVEPHRSPALTRERVLLIHNRRAGQEHFIREVVFRGASQPFGFVVPTPTRPEVAKMDNPFAALESGFAEPAADEAASSWLAAGGAGAPPGPASVKVLETSRVGSFTAFVLQANDPVGFAKWLREQGLEQGPETAGWLAHYVAMNFYYVALRYEPSQATTPGDIVAETIRISFATPVPYYPYFEPPTLGAIAGAPRQLDLWFVASELVRPVALERSGAARRWVEPFAPARTHLRARARLLATLPHLTSLLPPGDLVIQKFKDAKPSRQGLGDVLFGTVRASPFSAAELAQLTPLLPILDPELMP